MPRHVNEVPGLCFQSHLKKDHETDFWSQDLAGWQMNMFLTLFRIAHLPTEVLQRICKALPLLAPELEGNS